MIHELLDELTDRPLVVVGHAVLDRWISGRPGRLCREAPVPVVEVAEQTDVPGGAGNAAVAGAALGASIELVAAVGDDQAADDLAEALHRAGVATRSLVRVPTTPTMVKTRVQADEQVIARFDSPQPAGLDDTTAARLRAAVDAAVSRAAELGGAVLVSDYGASGLKKALGTTLASAAQRLPVVVDSHHPLDWRDVGAAAMTPNWGEAAQYWSDDLEVQSLGAPPDRAGWAERHAEDLLDACGASLVALTLDRDGALLLERGRPAHRAYARPVPSAATTGAGDSFAASFALALAARSEPAVALELAMAVAEFAVQTVGTTPPNAADLRRRLRPSEQMTMSVPDLPGLRRSCEGNGQRIVFTAGCFDVLHRGHVASLDAARRLGDVLVVGVDSDRRVRQLKGAGRPVQPAAERAAVLAALSGVDHVVMLEDDGPASALHALLPDLFVKGGDHDPMRLAESSVAGELGIELRIVDYVPDRSVTRILHGIKNDIKNA